MSHAGPGGKAQSDRGQDAVAPARLVFFLGGRDLEMVTIAQLVTSVLGGDAVVDKGLGWGAGASAYRDEIRAVQARGQRPALVELALDTPPTDTIVVDHHGARSDEPTSLEQVFHLLHLPTERWTRRFALVSANDRAHIAGMRAMGATVEEMEAIRRDDRSAQGITEAQEAAGRRALALAEPHLEGRLLVVHCPHDRVAAVADPLRLGEMERGEKPRDLLVLSPGELAYFGGASIVAVLARTFPGGWRGGDPPRSGFWGIARGPESPELADILATVATADVENLSSGDEIKQS